MPVSLFNDGDVIAAKQEAQRILRNEPSNSTDFVDAMAFLQKLEEVTTSGKSQKRTPLPVRAVISFYRSQISPCIGQRCLLIPSCSEYMLQACRKHGMLGIAIGIDRFYREPAVTGDNSKLVELPNRVLKYCDPVSDHDFWLNRKSDKK